MEYRSVILMTIVLMNACHKIDASLIEVPRDTEVMINDPTYLNCSTSLLANQVQWRHGNNYVYTGIALLEPYNARFSVEIDASTGACNLVIRSVQPSDAGTYECAEDEGIGDRRSVQLVVLGGDPVCKSNVPSDGIIGPNSCGIEPEEVKLSCSIKYHGNSLPVLQWGVTDDNQCVTGLRFKVTSINNEVTYTLRMKSSLGLNNSSFICQTTRTTDKQYSCSTDVINILYVFSNEITVNMTMKDEVNCLANTSQSCSYRWKWFKGNDSSTESANQILKPKKVGTHRCEATCSVRNESCTVQSMHATVYLEEEIRKRQLDVIEPQRREDEVDLQERLLGAAERRRLDEIEQQRREQEEQQKIPGLIATIRTKASEVMQKSIRGLAILDNELFVVSEECSEVEVYDSTNFSFSRRWTLKQLINPLDIVSCHKNKCLYIGDQKVVGLSGEIFRVDPNGKLIQKWSTKIDCGFLSLTYESNVILVVFHHNKLNEYSPDGQHMREIRLSSEEGFCHPRHAIKLTNGHFVVCHGFDEDDLHRVCIVDADGKLLKSFGGKCGSTNGQTHSPYYLSVDGSGSGERGSTIQQTNHPYYLSVDGSGSVMVADCFNSRVLLLDSNLEFKKEILTEEHGVRCPARILMDESNDRLFVSEYDPNNSRIMIFDLDLLRQTRNVSLNS